MPLDLERIEKKAISESVAEQLRMAILRGEVAVGERLPPERELAPRFGTNRNTLREAIRSLEAQGLVVARQGDGVRVTDFRNVGELSLLPDLLSLAEGDDRVRMLKDIFLMRRRMAVEVAGLAAERASIAHVDRLNELMARQREYDGDILPTLLTDLEMYRAMVDAADSVVARLMFATMERLSRTCIERIPALLYVHPDYVASMERVIAAVADKRAHDASAEMESLLRRTDVELMARIARV